MVSPTGSAATANGTMTDTLLPGTSLWRAVGDRLALDSNLAFRNKALEPRPADIREGLGQEAVETAGGAGFGL